MNKDTIEIKVAPCVVFGCNNEVNALIVASKDEDVKWFPACETHYRGVNKAVQVKFLQQDYAVVCYTELLRKK